MSIFLVTGGARSGKSRYAEERCLKLAGDPVYIATSEVFDDEMAERVSLHRQRRDARWQTIEEPLDLTGALLRSDGQGPRLVDCLTLWTSNLLLAEQPVEDHAKTLVAALSRQTSPVILVTNEVGLGIVPDNALARRFRDEAGRLNQMVAAVADEVVFCVCGLPMWVKGGQRAG